MKHRIQHLSRSRQHGGDGLSEQQQRLSYGLRGAGSTSSSKLVLQSLCETNLKLKKDKLLDIVNVVIEHKEGRDGVHQRLASLQAKSQEKLGLEGCALKKGALLKTQHRRPDMFNTKGLGSRDTISNAI